MSEKSEVDSENLVANYFLRKILDKTFREKNNLDKIYLDSNETLIFDNDFYKLLEKCPFDKYLNDPESLSDVDKHKLKLYKSQLWLLSPLKSKLILIPFKHGECWFLFAITDFSNYAATHNTDKIIKPAVYIFDPCKRKVKQYDTKLIRHLLMYEIRTRQNKIIKLNKLDSRIISMPQCNSPSASLTYVLTLINVLIQKGIGNVLSIADVGKDLFNTTDVSRISSVLENIKTNKSSEIMNNNNNIVDNLNPVILIGKLSTAAIKCTHCNKAGYQLDKCDFCKRKRLHFQLQSKNDSDIKISPNMTAMGEDSITQVTIEPCSNKVKGNSSEVPFKGTTNAGQCQDTSLLNQKNAEPSSSSVGENSSLIQVKSIKNAGQCPDSSLLNQQESGGQIKGNSGATNIRDNENAGQNSNSSFLNKDEVKPSVSEVKGDSSVSQVEITKPAGQCPDSALLNKEAKSSTSRAKRNLGTTEVEDAINGQRPDSSVLNQKEVKRSASLVKRMSTATQIQDTENEGESSNSSSLDQEEDKPSTGPFRRNSNAHQIEVTKIAGQCPDSCLLNQEAECSTSILKQNSGLTEVKDSKNAEKRSDSSLLNQEDVTPSEVTGNSGVSVIQVKGTNTTGQSPDCSLLNQEEVKHSTSEVKENSIVMQVGVTKNAGKCSHSSLLNQQEVKRSTSEVKPSTSEDKVNSIVMEVGVINNTGKCSNSSFLNQEVKPSTSKVKPSTSEDKVNSIVMEVGVIKNTGKCSNSSFLNQEIKPSTSKVKGNPSLIHVKTNKTTGQCPDSCLLNQEAKPSTSGVKQNSGATEVKIAKNSGQCSNSSLLKQVAKPSTSGVNRNSSITQLKNAEKCSDSLLKRDEKKSTISKSTACTSSKIQNPNTSGDSNFTKKKIKNKKDISNCDGTQRNENCEIAIFDSTFSIYRTCGYNYEKVTSPPIQPSPSTSPEKIICFDELSQSPTPSTSTEEIKSFDEVIFPLSEPTPSTSPKKNKSFDRVILSPSHSTPSTHHKKIKSTEKTLVKKNPLFTEYDGVPIHECDYECLQEGAYLNDEIINFYLRYFYKVMLHPNKKEKVHILPTYFYSKFLGAENRDDEDEDLNAISAIDFDESLAEMRYERSKHWANTVDLFEKDFIFVPIYKDKHWILAIICFPSLFDSGLIENDNKRSCLLILDSLEGTPFLKETSRNLKLFLTYYCKEKKNIDKNFRKMPTIYPKVERQPNGYDCGIFVLQYIEDFFNIENKKFCGDMNLKGAKRDLPIKYKRWRIKTLIEDGMIQSNVPFTLLPVIHINAPTDYEFIQFHENSSKYYNSDDSLEKYAKSKKELAEEKGKRKRCNEETDEIKRKKTEKKNFLKRKLDVESDTTNDEDDITIEFESIITPKPRSKVLKKVASTTPATSSSTIPTTSSATKNIILGSPPKLLEMEGHSLFLSKSASEIPSSGSENEEVSANDMKSQNDSSSSEYFTPPSSEHNTPTSDSS